MFEIGPGFAALGSDPGVDQSGAPDERVLHAVEQDGRSTFAHAPKHKAPEMRQMLPEGVNCGIDIVAYMLEPGIGSFAVADSAVIEAQERNFGTVGLAGDLERLAMGSAPVFRPADKDKKIQQPGLLWDVKEKE